MSRGFVDYAPLGEALRTLRRRTVVSPLKEAVPLGMAYGRVLFEDLSSPYNVPALDSAHMDGFAVRSRDLAGADEARPVELRYVKGSLLGVVPQRDVRAGEAQTVLTGGFMPKGSDAVVQVERTRTLGKKVLFTRAPARGEFVYPAGRDVRKGEVVLKRGRTLRGPDLVLLGSLHQERIPVYARPRVAVIPTGNELTEEIAETHPGKVTETHGLLLSRLIVGAGGVPAQMPIARDDLGEITDGIRAAMKTADIVLTLAGSSVGEADLTERAIGSLGGPGVLVHGMRVTRGRVMGFGAVGGKAIIILPGPIQGAVNAFSLMAYPLIRSFLGRGFEQPPSVPARMGNGWDAGDRFRDFTKVVYVAIDTSGPEVIVRASSGETENVTFLTRNDGYLLVDESTTSLKKGDAVRVLLLPGLSP